MGVDIIDLYALLAPDIKAFVGEDKVHLSPAGVERCARHVSEALLR
jgi:lysophospholipase L1-like esterase